MGKVTHFHLPVDDIERARKFYQEIFDWQITDLEFERDYQMINTVATDEQNMPLETGAINGALFKREKVDESPSVVVTVGSIDEAIKKAQSMGGELVRPRERVLDMGYFAEITDTEGNLIGLWEDIE